MRLAWFAAFLAACLFGLAGCHDDTIGSAQLQLAEGDEADDDETEDEDADEEEADEDDEEGDAADPEGMEQGRKITDEQAKKIALDTVAGDVTGIGVEKKLGKRTIVVEVFGQDGSETDVIIDMETGEVLGTEN